MGKVLILLSKDITCASHNAFIFSDEIEKDTRNFISGYNSILFDNFNTDEANRKAISDDEHINEIITNIDNFYKDNNENHLKELSKYGFGYTLIDDEETAIPCTSKSYMFVAQKEKENYEVTIIQDEIAPYAYSLTLEDKHYNTLRYKGQNFSSDFYSVCRYITDGAYNSNKSEATIKYDDGTKESLTCYRIKNYYGR